MKLLSLVSLAVAIPAGLGLLVYRLVPHAAYDALVALVRSRAGLRLRHVRSDGWDWPYLEGGNPAGEPLVMMHGFGADKDNWSYYAPWLGRQHRLIFPDLPGFGDNDGALNDDYRVSTQAARVVAFLDALGITDCHLGGNSMGGYIAVRVALDHPGRVRTLSLFNNAGVSAGNRSELDRMLLDEGITNPLAIESVADIDRVLAFVSHKPRRIPYQFKRVLVERQRKHGALREAILAQIVPEVLEKPLDADLPAISMPTLILWGRHDRLADVSNAEYQHQHIPNSELVIYDDIGHVPMIEQPRRVAERQTAFLSQHSRAG